MMFWNHYVAGGAEHSASRTRTSLAISGPVSVVVWFTVRLRTQRVVSIAILNFSFSLIAVLGTGDGRGTLKNATFCLSTQVARQALYLFGEDLCDHIADLVKFNVDFLNQAYKFAVDVANGFVSFLDSIITWLRWV